MTDQPPLPPPIWETLSPEARAAVAALVDSFERRIAQLEERLRKDSTNSSKPPSSDGPAVKRRPPTAPSGIRPGGQPGHPRHTRALVPPEQVRQVIDCKPPRCRFCGLGLDGADPAPLVHQVADLPPVRPVVDEYRLHRLRCPRCGTATCGALPAGVPAGAFRPRLQAALSLLAGAYRLGKRPIRQLASDLFGLDISLGAIAKLERQTAAVLEAPVEALRDHVRRAKAVHVDETSWRQGGEKAWLWVAVTGVATVFQVAATRGAAAAKALLGTAAKVVICDRWAGYGWVEVRQWCWAHLRRDFQAMIDRGGEAARVGGSLLGCSDRLFYHWHRVRDGTSARAGFVRWVELLRWEIRAELIRGEECSCARTAATCRELLAGEEHLWTFVAVAGVEPTNNAAERSLRPAVLYRKTSGGTAGAAGSRFVERILSVVATCRQRERNVLEYLTGCFQAHLDGAPIPSPFSKPTPSTKTP